WEWKASPSRAVTPPGVSARSATAGSRTPRTSSASSVVAWGARSGPARADDGKHRAAATATDRHDASSAAGNGIDIAAPKHKERGTMAARKSQGLWFRARAAGPG